MARNMRPEDIGQLVGVGEPRLRPDGAVVAFTVTTVDLEANEYRRRIWLAPTDESSPPRPFTAGEHRDGLPRWSPRGDELAFVSHRRDGSKSDGVSAGASHGGHENGCELYVAPVGVGGEVRKVAAWPEEIEELAWSPDGKRLAFLARGRDGAAGADPSDPSDPSRHPPRRVTRLFYRLDSVGWRVDRARQLFVVAADGSSKPQAVTAGPFEVEGLSWSPDGTRLAFSSARHETWDLDLATDLFVTELPEPGGDVAAPQQLTKTDRVYGSPSWSPDGSTVAFNFFGDPQSEPQHGQIGVLDLDTGHTEILTTSIDRQCVPFPTAREPVWLSDGRSLAWAVEDGGNTHLYATNPLRRLVGGDREVTAFDALAGTIAFCATTATATTELFVLDPETGEERQLTHVGLAFGQARRLVPPIPFLATAPDGNQVQGWVMAPPDAEPGVRYPTLLNIHGGPFTQYGNRFFDEFQLQAGAGFAVVYANPRGSSGSTEAAARAIRWPEAEEDPGSGWGGVDYDDLMAVMDEATERFEFVDPDRLGVLGGSYGGYMTSWIVGHNQRFRAACSERSTNNLLALEHSSDSASAFRTLIGVSHLDNPEAYLRQSPITYVANMTTPMLLIHSEDDLRCPLGQAEELFVALRLLGRQPELVVFPGESHELSRSGSPRHRVQRAEIILEWFGRHLASHGEE